MTSETFVTAIFLVTAIIAAGVLVNAIFPSIYQASETFVAGSHEMDDRMRTDIRIINTVIHHDDSIAHIWIKNTGVSPIPKDLIHRFDIFLGETGRYQRLTYVKGGGPAAGEWNFTLYDDNGNGLWDRGETLEIIARGTDVDSGDRIVFQVVLPNGVRRSTEFTAV